MTEKQRAVREIQQSLRNIEKNYSEEPSLIPDGIYSEETRMAVERFQRRQGLEVTGVVDYETWELIIRESRLVDKKREQPIQVVPIKNEDLPLRQGDNNEFVATAKMMLSRVADKYEKFNRLTVDNYFDSFTENEVIRWQSVAFLPESGEIDRETWDSLALHYLIQ